MDLAEFHRKLTNVESQQALISFTQEHCLHGTPHVFKEREAEYFGFKDKLCKKFEIIHGDIFIVGSAKLGFSPHKRTPFSLDSDIDVAIVSAPLFDRVFCLASDLEYRIRARSIFMRTHHWERYHKLLRYSVIGWMRPDLLPTLEPVNAFRSDWFDFFKSVSHGKSEVGNYTVTAGVFKRYEDLERYTVDSMAQVKASLAVGEQA